MTEPSPNMTKSRKTRDSPMHKNVFECSHCRENFEEIKMCSGCKVVGYCSKSCQRLDWKEHKHYCKGTFTGKPAMGRDPVVKVLERFAGDAEIMSWVKGLLISVLDLAHHPENSTKYGVVILAGIRPASASTGTTSSPQHRKKVPMLFNVLQAKRFTNDQVDLFFPGLKALSEDLNRKLDEKVQGSKREDIVVVRAAFVSTVNTSAVKMFCDDINLAQSTYVQRLGCTTEDLIRHLNAQPELHPDIKEKFTIRVPTEE